jgi:hypothetical protein
MIPCKLCVLRAYLAVLCIPNTDTNRGYRFVGFCAVPDKMVFSVLEVHEHEQEPRLLIRDGVCSAG